ncbi:MAG: proline dehydrogenase family protein [Gemmatimonadales bacterium]
MPLARSLLLRAADNDWLARQMSERAFARRAVRRFMPGETLEAALVAAQSLAAQGLGTLLTQLGEGLTDERQAAEVRDHYLGAFDRIAHERLPTAVSIKPTQLGLDFSFDVCKRHLAALADRAEATGSRLWIDMEDSRYVDRTLDLYRATLERHPRAGLAIQSYLRRTPADIEALIPLSPTIRLVKGAYQEPATVAFAEKRETDLAYFAVGRRLLEAAADGRGLPVFGTHDMVLVNRLVDAARELGVPDDRYEIHMLYGIGSSNQHALKQQGRTVKTLISYGAAWFKWYMRRLAERPANVWFVMKSVFS